VVGRPSQLDAGRLFAPLSEAEKVTIFMTFKPLTYLAYPLSDAFAKPHRGAAKLGISLRWQRNRFGQQPNIVNELSISSRWSH
jgi:hypothetical protein